MVAIDANGKAVPVPSLQPESREEKLRFLQGKLRRELRTEQKNELESRAAEFEKASDAELESMVAADRIIRR